MSYVFTISMHPKKHADVLAEIVDRMERDDIKKSEAIRRLIIEGARAEMYRKALEAQTARFHRFQTATMDATGWPKVPISSPLELVEEVKSGLILP
jgi:hypothetical protein